MWWQNSVSHILFQTFGRHPCPSRWSARESSLNRLCTRMRWRSPRWPGGWSPFVLQFSCPRASGTWRGLAESPGTTGCWMWWRCSWGYVQCRNWHFHLPNIGRFSDRLLLARMLPFVSAGKRGGASHRSRGGIPYCSHVICDRTMTEPPTQTKIWAGPRCNINSLWKLPILWYYALSAQFLN